MTAEELINALDAAGITPEALVAAHLQGQGLLTAIGEAGLTLEMFAGILVELPKLFAAIQASSIDYPALTTLLNKAALVTRIASKEAQIARRKAEYDALQATLQDEFVQLNEEYRDNSGAIGAQQQAAQQGYDADMALLEAERKAMQDEANQLL